MNRESVAMSPRPNRKLAVPRWLKRFTGGQAGTVTSEFVIMFPILIWAWIGMFYYWDVYRAQNLAQKASYAVADNLSRSVDEVTQNYVNGMGGLLTYLSQADTPVRLRVTSIKWNATTLKHEVSWSYSPNNKFPKLTNTTLDPIRNRLPTLVQYETVLLIETAVDYVPPLNIDRIGDIDLGVGPQTFNEFIVTRPRFVNKVCLTGTTCA
jgi:Flp pilus assembly protein TadG